MTTREYSASRRLASMDGLRGFAAILVLVYHFQLADPSTVMLPSSYLAVDLFFMLSGYVVALAYEDRLAAGDWFWGFIRARFMRLYPLAMLGTVLGAVALLTSSTWQAGTPWQMRAVASGLPFAAAFFPRLGEAHYFAFPLNPPMWSLFFELWINVAFAAFLPWLTNKRLLLVAGLGAIGVLAVGGWWHSLDAGRGGWTLVGGLARVCWSFPVGVLIYRFQRVGYLDRLPKLPGCLLLLALAVSCIPQTLGFWSTIAACGSTLIIFPMIVAAASISHSHPIEERLYQQIGDLSYAIYALHFPVFMLCQQAVNERSVDPSYGYAGGVAASLLIAAFAAKYVDKPVRLFLMQLEKGWMSRRNESQLSVYQNGLAAFRK